jgi:Trk K+ transport system NAD-binding subunit
VILHRTKVSVNKNALDSLVNFSKGYSVTRVIIQPNSKLIKKSVEELDIKANHIQVINVDKGHEMIPFVESTYIFEAGDCLTVYGKLDSIKRYFA